MTDVNAIVTQIKQEMYEKVGNPATVADIDPDKSEAAFAEYYVEHGIDLADVETLEEMMTLAVMNDLDKQLERHTREKHAHGGSCLLGPKDLLEMVLVPLRKATGLAYVVGHRQREDADMAPEHG